MLKLNYGCGEQKLEGFINIDAEKKTKPDLVHDLKKSPFPYKDASVDEVFCIHNLEHIEYRYWGVIFTEFNRVLKEGGKLVLGYPEFEECVEFFLNNHRGMKDFWRATLYGRQLYRGDYHVSPVVTSDLVPLLKRFGFRNIKHGPDLQSEGYTYLRCIKGNLTITRADILKEIFDDVQRDKDKSTSKFK
jgi:SAM-dependent methyltransferase